MYGMNQNYNAQDPSSQVPDHLLPHVHLISSYRFPTLPSLQPAHALDYLTKSPQIVKNTAAVAWTYFPSPPPDGTVILTWQPPRLQTSFASDGLVWADPEVMYEMQIRGFNLQVLIHKSGYHYPHEQFATHARFRYRITTGPGQYDPNLWIVHYTTAEPGHRIPSGQVPIPREIHAQLQARAQLQTAGPLMRKEFMLQDQANWPKVEFGQGAARGPPYYNPMQPGRPSYPAQPPPAKRQRLPTQQQVRQTAPSTMVADASFEEEENATQDIFDSLTPRDISLSRYKQHHEWMEEVFSSPYAVGKILPIDLGLGLMGELAHLTAGILDAPAGENPRAKEFDSRAKDYDVKSYHRLSPEQLKEFEDRVSMYTAQEEAEIEKMKAAHAKKMTNMKRTRTYIKSERRLRDLARTGHNTDSASEQDVADPLDVVIQELESSLGVAFDPTHPVVCIEKGGFIEEQQPPAQKPQQVNNNGAPSHLAPNNGSGGLGDDAAIDTDNTAASLLDQFGSGSLSGTPGPNLSVPRMSQPPSQSQSAVATPNALLTQSTQGTTITNQATIDATGVGNELLDLDVEMSGMATADEKGGEGDWVLVEDQAAPSEQQSAITTEQPSAGAVAESGGETEEATTTMFDTADFGSFDNLDTAGDALADYTNVDDNMGLDLVDDSAFGDAFHATELHQGDAGDGHNA
ncbi:hypothetical protein BDV95DRAFT_4208 [Massariosphaeria phaeospora]|uniref:DUF1750-domain-containing protein n=1 Tax=Massariosphaeria phaeospora TaxID=100035 RepID=A0A7C8MY53_9PLEO|nr:hypothetical protein BDV95DRAFT_4208 [Massariosphaeria phaeospora]